MCLAILKHHRTVFVIDIGQGKCFRGELVEEALFCIAVFQEGLVVIEMVVGEVAEDRPIEVNSRNSLLVNGVRADLHETVGASGGDHLGH